MSNLFKSDTDSIFKKDTIEEAISCVERIDPEKLIRRNRKKSSGSSKPLIFEESDTYSNIKNAIIRQINARDLTYDDVKDFCNSFIDDKEKATKSAFNLINSLKSRPSMMDTTISLYCDFLNLDILFATRRDEDPTLAAAIDLVVALKEQPERYEEIKNFIDEKMKGEKNELAED